MARTINMAVLVVFGVLAAALLQGTEAAEYTVGGTRGWTNVNNATFYSDWEDPLNFTVGDVLVFNFATNAHDVAKVTETEYEACTTPNSQNITTTGPARITLDTIGDHYFICTIPGHCSGGQKLDIEVTAGNGSTSPPPGSSPPPPAGTVTSPPPAGTVTSPPPAGTVTSPPPTPSSASSLVATFSGIFMSIVIGLSF